MPENERPATGSGADLRLLGKHRILRSIGSGGMSEVFLAYDGTLRRQIAVKVLADHLSTNHTFVNRFEQEGRLSKQLSHPRIVKGYSYGRDKVSGRYFMTMEFVDGPTAQERLEKEGRFPLSAAVRIVIDIALALEYLHHQRYVHRDIKPGNILLEPDGRAKLADLGVAKFLEKDCGLTTIDQNVGTPYYMPWEQSVNSSLVDIRTDIFALGATLYHLVTGHVPFPGEDEAAIAKAKARGIYKPAREHDPALPALFDTILERMLARDPRKRFACARDLAEVLTASGLAEGRGEISNPDLSILIPQPLAPTRADMKTQSEVDTPLEPDDDQIWQVKFQREEDGEWRRLHGRTRDVVRRYEMGELPDQLFAAREPSRVFRRLKAYPEFRKVVHASRVIQAEREYVSPLRRPRRKPAPTAGWSWLDCVRALCLTGFVALLIGCSAILCRLIAAHQ